MKNLQIFDVDNSNGYAVYQQGRKKNLYQLTRENMIFEDCTNISFKTSVDLGDIKEGKKEFEGCHMVKCVDGTKVVFYTDLEGFNLPSDCSYLFAESTLERICLDKVYSFGVTDMTGMFEGSKIAVLDLSNFDVSKVKKMGYCCSSCENLRRIKFFDNVNSCKTMIGFLSECEALQEVELGYVYAPNLEDITFFFKDCKNLWRIDGRIFSSKAMKAAGVFYNCKEITNIEFPFICEFFEDLVDCCMGCTELKRFEGSQMSFKGKTKGFFDDCESLKYIEFACDVDLDSVLPMIKNHKLKGLIHPYKENKELKTEKIDF